MTKDMPFGGNLSLDMMYRTCGTQLNIDYNSEEDFTKKFKVVNSISSYFNHFICKFINCRKNHIHEKVITYHIDQKFGKTLVVLEEVFQLFHFFLKI